MPKSSNLSLNLPAHPKEKNKSSGGLRSPPISPPYHSPSSPRADKDFRGGVFGTSYDQPQSPITALPQNKQPSSPKLEKPRGIFSSSKFSRSQTRLPQESHQQLSDSMSAKQAVYQQGRSPGSTPELGIQAIDSSSASDPSSPRAESLSHQHLVAQKAVKSQSEPHLINDPNLPNSDAKGARRERTNKPKFGQILGRSKSIRRDESPASRGTRGPAPENEPNHYAAPSDTGGLRTAPIDMRPQDKTLREIMRPSKRNRSADRGPPRSRGPPEDYMRASSKERREPTLSSSFKDKDSQPGNFFQNIRNSKSKASDLGKVSKGFLGKLTRSGSSHDREDGDGAEAGPNPDTYEPQVIRRGLIEQTRLTRISKRLEKSHDKTEFWLPALPWRCIDYLNLKGTEIEGLYRVGGSLREVKKWQMRFDIEGDIDLLNEESLYDVNIVASLLKDWLRKIPDEIFPKATQKMIQDKCPDAANLERCPPILADELSRLPPFNYYLLFAITCHLSLLTSCYEKTKMDFDNLCVCIQPSLNLDRFIFRILIKDWRNCWQGCYTEKEYLYAENEYLAGLESQYQERETESESERSARPSHRPGPSNHTRQPASNDSHALISVDGNSRSATPEERSERPLPSTIRTIELSPLKPLSPIGPL